MIKITLLALALLLPSDKVAEAKRVELDVEFCQLPLPDGIKRANASFYVTAAFRVSADGKPTHIEVVKPGENTYVAEAVVAECVKGWTLAGLPPNTRVVATWRWNHGRGWESLAVSGPGISYRVKATGERCPHTNP